MRVLGKVALALIAALAGLYLVLSVLQGAEGIVAGVLRGVLEWIGIPERQTGTTSVAEPSWIEDFLWDWLWFIILVPVAAAWMVDFVVKKLRDEAGQTTGTTSKPASRNSDRGGGSRDGDGGARRAPRAGRCSRPAVLAPGVEFATAVNPEPHVPGSPMCSGAAR